EGIDSVCAGSGCKTQPIFLGPQTVSTTGSYSVALFRSSGDTGSAQFTVYDVSDVTQPPIAVNGSTVPIALNTPGQVATLNLTGTSAGMNVTVRVTNNQFTTNRCATVSLLNPDGTTLAYVDSFSSPSSCSASFSLPT